jgi:hypothetical protein
LIWRIMVGRVTSEVVETTEESNFGEGQVVKRRFGKVSLAILAADIDPAIRKGIGLDVEHGDHMALV